MIVYLMIDDKKKSSAYSFYQGLDRRKKNWTRKFDPLINPHWVIKSKIVVYPIEGTLIT